MTKQTEELPEEVADLRLSQFKEMVRSEAKNLNMEDFGEEYLDALDKRIKGEVEGALGETSGERKLKSVKQMERALLGAERRTDGQHARDYSAVEFSKGLMTLAKAKCQEGPYLDKALDEMRAQGFDTGAFEKALTASDFSAGGALLDSQMSGDFIGFLYNNSVVRAMGASVVRMERGGQIDFGKGGTSAVAYWGSETESITASEPDFRQLNLSAKKLRVLVPLSNDLLRQAPPGFETIVRDDVTNVAVVAEDTAFIRGSGTAGAPKGIRNQMSSDNVKAISGSNTLSVVTSDLLRQMYLVRKSNIPMERLAWFLHPRTMYFLMSLRSSDGYHVFREELVNGSLYGAPVGTTQNIPSNLDDSGDGSNNETEIYFGSMAQVVIGDTLSVEVKMSDTASFVQNSEQKNSFQEDLTVLRLIHEADLLLRYDKAFSVTNAVDWGADFDAA